VTVLRADVVGSLLRPSELLKAQQELLDGRIDPGRFHEIEDRAVDQAIALQESAGLGVVTDGEMRRQSFQSQMTAAVSGFGEPDLNAFLWGSWRDDQGVVHIPRPARLGVVGRLVRQRALSVHEFDYLRTKTTKIAKITLPSPGLWVNLWSRDQNAYPSLDAFLADVVSILRAEVEELVRHGANYIQLDAPHYGLLLDPQTRGFYEAQGWSLAQWLGAGVELDNAVMDGFPSVTFGVHV
jgi:5-methyltetrahydropteroyltriglutamate--homocysteine methyltransferase